MGKRLNRRPRKRFGQHFLVDERVLQQMADVIRPRAGDRLLEIGPGYGALTDYLAGRCAQYKAVEIDRDMIAALRGRFADIEVLNADILKVSLAEILDPPGWRLIGNLPYNISSPLLLKLFTGLPLIEDMHFMFQREMGQRLTAVPGTKSWGRLSVLTQYYCVVEPLFDVAPEAFQPPPKVYSQVVRMTPRAELIPVDLNTLISILRTAFSARRKRIDNALKNESIDWSASGVDGGTRPDQLSVQQYVDIANSVEAVG